MFSRFWRRQRRQQISRNGSGDGQRQSDGVQPPAITTGCATVNQRRRDQSAAAPPLQSLPISSISSINLQTAAVQALAMAFKYYFTTTDNTTTTATTTGCVQLINPDQISSTTTTQYSSTFSNQSLFSTTALFSYNHFSHIYYYSHRSNSDTTDQRRGSALNQIFSRWLTDHHQLPDTRLAALLGQSISQWPTDSGSGDQCWRRSDQQSTSSGWRWLAAAQRSSYQSIQFTSQFQFDSN